MFGFILPTHLFCEPYITILLLTKVEVASGGGYLPRHEAARLNPPLATNTEVSIY